MESFTKGDYEEFLGKQFGLIKEAKSDGDRKCEKIATDALINILSDAVESGFTELQEQTTQQLIRL